MPWNRPNWALLKEYAKKLRGEGKAPFSRRQLMDRVREKHLDRSEGPYDTGDDD